ncbi:hypothetical protein L195_g062089, partial [Trifolium pratense]
MVGNDVEYMTP